MTNVTPSLTNAAAPAATNDIHAIKPPLVIPNGWLWFWGILAALLLAGAAYLAWRFWRKKGGGQPPIPEISAHHRALSRLQEAMALISQPRPFCIMVSDAVRFYLEERFDFRAPERTTEEFLHELKATELLLPDQKESLGQFLSVCDMVKFAKYEPGQPELQALHDAAVRMIEETEPQPIATDATATQGVIT